jgi:hypothetical protein
MKRRAKRYQEGGETEAVPMPDLEERRREITDYISKDDRDEEPMAKTFKQAFASARRAGERTFMHGGKRYTTELASEKKRVRSTAPTPDESAAETARLARQAKMTGESKAEAPKSKSMGYGVPAALGAAALAAGASAIPRRMRAERGAAGRRVEPSMSESKVQTIDPFDQMAMDRMTGEGGRKKGGHIKAKKMASGGTASKRADGIAQRGKTRGRIC